MDLHQFITGKFSAVNQNSIALLEKGRKIMKARIFFAAVLIAAFCTVSLSYADGPQMINYQGYLTDNDGAPVTDTVGLTFGIYDDSTAGNLLWDEYHATVSVEEGIFNILLGSVDSIGLAVFDGDARYLEIAVDGRGPMTPRRPMVGVPYAFHCFFKDKDWCWSIDRDDMHPCDLNDDVGIGTATPEAPLHVENLTLGDQETAVKVDFGSSVGSLGNWGIVAETDLTAKGGRIGVRGISTFNASGNSGSVDGGLAKLHVYDMQGAVSGVYGGCSPSSLDNYDGTSISWGVGGYFRALPPAGPPLDLDGTGTYYVGGVLGKADGEVNAAGDNAIVAGVIGQDNSTGTATSWAGYFDGDVHVTDKVGIGTKSPSSRLHVMDDIRIESTTGGPILFMNGATGGVSAIDFYEGGSGPMANITYHPGYSALMLGHGVVSSDLVIKYAGPNVGMVGIGTTNPQRALHISDVMRLEPRGAAPVPASEGDIYVNSADHHIWCYLNGGWKQLDP